MVFLSGVIATPATIGYERLRNLIVTSVNGQPVDLQSLVAAFEQPTDNLHAIKFEEEECPVHLDELVVQRRRRAAHRARHPAAGPHPLALGPGMRTTDYTGCTDVE